MAEKEELPTAGGEKAEKEKLLQVAPPGEVALKAEVAENEEGEKQAALPKAMLSPEAKKAASPKKAASTLQVAPEAPKAEGKKQADMVQVALPEEGEKLKDAEKLKEVAMVERVRHEMATCSHGVSATGSQAALCMPKEQERPKEVEKPEDEVSPYDNSLAVASTPFSFAVMEHARMTDWDTLVKQLQAGRVPYLRPGTMDPTHSFYWMLVGFNVQERDYPAAQQFAKEDHEIFSADICQMATKCQLCLRAVLHTW